ncbi:MAG: hypothetical protein OEX77_00435 [Candidatus Bathyarchaeota archaeon]|nr:hypothetical protein [Candidatus Bathyarchaeota archaeon]MDH5732657.1 hypothetical protein [Candidatus Bathyarchaeota archaeon]
MTYVPNETRRQGYRPQGQPLDPVRTVDARGHLTNPAGTEER